MGRVAGRVGGERLSRLGLAAVYAGIALLLPLGARLKVEHLPRVWHCPVKSITSLPCAACGTTRAMAALGHGRMTEALRWNPGAVLGWAALLLWPLVEAVRSGYGRRTGRPAPDLPGAWLRWGLVAGLVGNWAVLIWLGR